MSGTMAAGDYNPNATIGNGGGLPNQLGQQLGGQAGAFQVAVRQLLEMDQRAQLVRAYGDTAPAYDAWAVIRALRLLWKHLTPEQRGQYKLFSPGLDHEGHSFIVRGNASGHHYRIFEAGSVIRLRDEHRFCLVLTGEPVPPPDIMLAKKLLLENDEGLFLATANDLSGPPPHYAADAELNQQMVQVLLRQRVSRTIEPPAPGTNRRSLFARARQRIRIW